MEKNPIEFVRLVAFGTSTSELQVPTRQGQSVWTLNRQVLCTEVAVRSHLRTPG